MDAASAPPVGAAAVGAAAAGAAAALAAGAACDAFMLPLCEEQQRVKELAMAGKNLFLTGCGGCGKSHLIKHLVAAWEREGKEVALAAMTGCAAELIGGSTLHSVLKMGAVNKVGHAVSVRRKRAEKLGELDVLILDEVSMLSAELFQYVVENITHARRLIFSERLQELGPDGPPQAIARLRGLLERPLCGLQVLLVGDLLQLPPVDKGEVDAQKAAELAVQNLEEKLVKDGKLTGRQIRNSAAVCNRGLVFQTDAWRRLQLSVCVLKQVHRQRDLEFIRILQAIRAGTASEAQLAALWRACSRPLHERPTWVDDGILPTRLYCKNVEVERENAEELARLPGPAHESRAAHRLEPKVRRGEDLRCKAVLRRGQKLRELMPRVLGEDRKVKELLVLKEGAQVMCTANLMQGLLVNGSRGVVVGFVDAREQLAALKDRVAQLQQALHGQAYGGLALGGAPAAASGAAAAAAGTAGAAGGDEDAETLLLSDGSAVTAASPQAAASPAGGSSGRAAKRRRLSSPAAASSSRAAQCQEHPAGGSQEAERQDSSQQGSDEVGEELPATQEVPQQSAGAAGAAELAAATAAAELAACAAAASAASPAKLSGGGAGGFVLASDILVQECASEAAEASAPSAAQQRAKPPGGFTLASDPSLWAGGAGGQQQQQQQQLQRAGVSPVGVASAGRRLGMPTTLFGTRGVPLPVWDGEAEEWPYSHLPPETQFAIAEREIQVLTDFIHQQEAAALAAAEQAARLAARRRHGPATWPQGLQQQRQAAEPPPPLALPVVRWASKRLQGRCTVVRPWPFEYQVLGKGKIVRLQLPLMLAWALTIHKAQGLTLDRVVADLSGVFASGQGYVALSRASSIEGLQIAGTTNPLHRLKGPNKLALQFYAAHERGDRWDQEAVAGDGDRGAFPLESDFPGYAEAFYRTMRAGPQAVLTLDEMPHLLRQAAAAARQPQHWPSPGQQRSTGAAPARGAGGLSPHAQHQQGWRQQQQQHQAWPSPPPPPQQQAWPPPQQQQRQGWQQQPPQQQQYQAWPPPPPQQQQDRGWQQGVQQAVTPPPAVGGPASGRGSIIRSLMTGGHASAPRAPQPSYGAQQQQQQQQQAPAALLAPPVAGPVALHYPPHGPLLQVHSCARGQLSPLVLESREVLKGCATQAELLVTLRASLRLPDGLPLELWMLDAAGACQLVGSTLPPALVLEAACGLLVHVRAAA